MVWYSAAEKHDSLSFYGRILCGERKPAVAPRCLFGQALVAPFYQPHFLSHESHGAWDLLRELCERSWILSRATASLDSFWLQPSMPSFARRQNFAAAG